MSDNGSAGGAGGAGGGSFTGTTGYTPMANGGISGGQVFTISAGGGSGGFVIANPTPIQPTPTPTPPSLPETYSIAIDPPKPSKYNLEVNVINGSCKIYFEHGYYTGSNPLTNPGMSFTLFSTLLGYCGVGIIARDDLKKLHDHIATFLHDVEHDKYSDKPEIGRKPETPVVRKTLF